MLAFREAGSAIVVDCGGDVVQRLQACGIPLDEITAVIITHEHPDHVSGFALMVQKLWLAGRRAPLSIHGIAPALDQARYCFAAFDTSDWEGLPEIRWLEFPQTAGTLVLETPPWRVTAVPTLHNVPSVALRVDHLPTGSAAVYSSDTAPSPAVAELARNARILIHEATGPRPGHSTAIDAAHIAATAAVETLYLVHIPPDAVLDDATLAAARAIFPRTFKATDLEAINF